MLEKSIERKVCHYARSKDFLTPKIHVVGESGWPDRLLIDPEGWCIWIEFKAPGKKPDALQGYRMEQLMNRGMPVFVVDNEEDGIELINRLDSARLPKKSNEALSIARERGIISGPRTREDFDCLGGVQDP